jgi:hypothetical protein
MFPSNILNWTAMIVESGHSFADGNKTSLDKTGSDAMNAAGDYSSAYCILYTDSEYEGHGMVWIDYELDILHFESLTE